MHFFPHVTPYFDQAKKEILLASPYFVPGENGVRWFEKKTGQGVNISILTNSLAATDVIAVHAGYKKYRKQLVDTGISLFELKPSANPSVLKTEKLLEGSSSASLHAKYMVVDRQYVFIGSANLDPRSENLNTEIGIMVDSEALALQAIRLFERTTSVENSYQIRVDKTDNTLSWITEERGVPIRYFNEPKTGLLKRAGVFILGLLPIESLL